MKIHYIEVRSIGKKAREFHLNGCEIIDKGIIEGRQNRYKFSIDFICDQVCEYFELTDKQLKAETRRREIVQARQIAMYFSKNMTNASLSTIGYAIGEKDHSTVLHACKTVRDLIDTNRNFGKIVKEIEIILKSKNNEKPKN